ncbi:MAG: NADPH-dependent assimilatory sulfite reductase hemoprotein subunit [Gammaproteobacteria bacterium]|nr:NADPH-dependent assimilatory sulfite reductase hemoprotein subunit [Gammaproteobacteria bacterium]
MTDDKKKSSPVEKIKTASENLRGTIAEGLRDAATGAIAEDDTQLTKFHGIYQQDDRELRAERARQKLEPAYSFMARVRVPGGRCTTEQWLALDSLAQQYGGGALRITTRQAVQFHGLLKRDLKATIQGIDRSLMDTFAACGDVNRNVMCTPLAEQSPVHASALHWAQILSDQLTPKTGAYNEIWLDGKKVTSQESATAESEPLYGPTYLPRKFKIAIAIPPHNDVDVFAHDLGFIAIERDGQLIGFNVTVGGGMGATHNDPATYPRLADVIGFCPPDQVVAVAEAVITTQRDFGDRSERKHARLKYTIDDGGLDWFSAEVSRRSGYKFQPSVEFKFTSNADRFGWQHGTDDLWHLALFVPSGRVVDRDNQRWSSGLRAVAEIHEGDFLLTPNQNLIISGVSATARERIDNLLAEYGLDLWKELTPLRLNAMACVALPTCGLAMAEAERYLPDFMDRVAAVLARHKLPGDDITVRITGCPNGCARPYVADIGLVGKAPGRYNLFLGGGHAGQRLNRLVKENLDENAILEHLDPIFGRYAAGRQDNEAFGDWLNRAELAA